MKKPNIVLLIILSVIVIATFISLSNIYGNHFKTMVNNPTIVELKERPRLEDDYFDYTNYELLKTNNLKADTEMWFYMYDEPERMIKEQKETYIKNILSKCAEYEEESSYKKICDFYNSYKNTNKESLLKELKIYIDKINNTNTIKEYVSTVIDVDKELSLDILVNPSVNRTIDNHIMHFSLDPASYDYEYNILENQGIDLTTVNNYVYTNPELMSVVRYLNKYSKNNLMSVGYTEEEASKMASNVQLFYSSIAKDSMSITDYQKEKGNRLYNFDDLKSQLKRIDIEKITANYDKLYTPGDQIVVGDVKQLKAIDKYLLKKNLPVLKDYAISKIVNKYIRYIDSDAYNEYLKLYDFLIYNIIQKQTNSIKDFDSEKLVYTNIYKFFMDTIASDMEKDILSPEEKQFYIDLVKEEIEIFKENIQTEEWLTPTTKNIAYNKLDKISYNVSVPEEPVYAENNYIIGDSYLSNIISINKSIREEKNNQWLNGNLFYGEDYFTQNAFYQPANNSINILLGEIVSMRYANGITNENFRDKKYEIFGSLGTVIGHELTHSLDDTGSQYDEYGSKKNWWTTEDKEAFNKLNAKVVKYYYKYNMLGNDTLGENIADLGGMKLALKMAAKYNATNDDYKTLFESYSKSWCSQSTNYNKYLLIEKDSHSANKVRVNAVLSSIDKFYEVYNIKSGDQMYTPESERVKVW